MRVAFVGTAPREDLGQLAEDLAAGLAPRGHLLAAEISPEVDLVFNLTGAEAPAAHWRRAHRQQFGVTLLACPEGSLAAAGDPSRSSELLELTYPALVRTMSNAVLALDGERQVLVTPELGLRPLAAGAAEALDALLPLAGARFCIENRVREDLPRELRGGNESTRALSEGGQRLAALGLLPSPVCLRELLSPADRRLLHAIYGIQQLSYGNLSVREPSGGFWMTGRGVDKSRLETIGRELLLVVGWTRSAGSLDLAVPRGHGEARVSVDAMEHALLYERFAEIGAILHVHAWMEGVPSTLQSWPCGTVELAEEVADLVSRQPDPARAAIGLRNHGLTITGPSLDEIFQRIEGRLQLEVPPT